MNKIQKWVDEHDAELSMIANAYGLNQVEAVIKVLNEGMDKSMDDTSDLMGAVEDFGS